MAYYDSFQQLSSAFKIGEDIDIEQAGVFVRNYSFKSQFPFSDFPEKNNSFIVSDAVKENGKFTYPVFINSPEKSTRKL